MVRLEGLGDKGVDRVMNRWLIRASSAWAVVLIGQVLVVSAQDMQPADGRRISQFITPSAGPDVTPPLENALPEGSRLAAYRGQLAGYQQQLAAAECQFNGLRDDLAAQHALLDQQDTELEQAVRQRIARRQALGQRARAIGDRLTLAAHRASLVEWQREAAQHERSETRWERSFGTWQGLIKRWRTEAKHQSKAFEVMSSYLASLSQELSALRVVAPESLTADEMTLSMRAGWQRSEELAREMGLFLEELEESRAALTGWQQSLGDHAKALSAWDQLLRAWEQRLDAWEQWVAQQIPAAGRTGQLGTISQNAAVTSSSAPAPDPVLPVQAGR